METIGARIAFVRGQNSRKIFAEMLGVPANTLRNYESGVSLPNSEFIANICSKLKLNPYWLLFGMTHPAGLNIYADHKGRVMGAHSDRPKFGNYKTLTKQLDTFKARSSTELVDAVKRNMHLYKRFSLIYYDSSLNMKYNRGYSLALIGDKDGNTYDLYDTNALCTHDDIFLIEFVAILSSVYSLNIPLYEAYVSEDNIRDLVNSFVRADLQDELDVVHLADMDYFFFDKQIEMPTILYKFHKTDLQLEAIST